MTQGNPIALKNTLESFKNVCNQFIIGDMCVFSEDSKTIKSYKSEYPIKIVYLPFNYIFVNGFGKTLNLLAKHSKNDLVLYMNVSEVIDGEHRIKELLETYPQYNCYAFDHETDPHTWFRCYRKSELVWSGLIHEELVGDKRPFTHYIFRMKDTDKDNNDLLKAKIYDSIKECVYFNQYIRLVDNPELLGGTNPGWLKFAKENYDSMKERLWKKGDLFYAYRSGNLDLLDFCIEKAKNQEMKFESNPELIDFQTDKKTLL